MTIDLSHASDQVAKDVLASSAQGIVASHSNARKLTPHPRNLSDELIQKIADKNELAALIAREIVKVDASYWGYFKGYVGSAQIRFAPKKYEIYFDSAAVDLMVKAGYNPIGMITFLHKVYPQKRSDFIATSNLTSKRVMYVYEYIYKTYPEFLADNAYRENKYYQNFLLTSTENRAKFYEKMRTNSDEKIKYE